MVTTFQRARSADQRAERRQAILETAATMLTEMPVAELSLNNLSRRVCLAKSNVLRYFDSREAVLLELLQVHWVEWLQELGSAVPQIRQDTPIADRVDALAALLADAAARREVFCDLLGAQATVLERNVSVSVAASFKRGALQHVHDLGEIAASVLPELTEDDRFSFAAAALLAIGALWAHSRPSAAMLQAYEDDPSLASLRLDFTDTLRQLLAVLLSGLLARADQQAAGSGGPTGESPAMTSES